MALLRDPVDSNGDAIGDICDVKMRSLGFF